MYPFDIKNNIITSDSFSIEIKGYFKADGKINRNLEKSISNYLRSYAKNQTLYEILHLVETEKNYELLDKINSIFNENHFDLKEFKINTINASERIIDDYNIDPQLENQSKSNKSGGLFSKFKRKK